MKELTGVTHANPVCRMEEEELVLCHDGRHVPGQEMTRLHDITPDAIASAVHVGIVHVGVVLVSIFLWLWVDVRKLQACAERRLALTPTPARFKVYINTSTGTPHNAFAISKSIDSD